MKTIKEMYDSKLGAVATLTDEKWDNELDKYNAFIGAFELEDDWDMECIVVFIYLLIDLPNGVQTEIRTNQWYRYDTNVDDVKETMYKKLIEYAKNYEV